MRHLSDDDAVRASPRVGENFVPQRLQERSIGLARRRRTRFPATLGRH